MTDAALTEKGWLSEFPVAFFAAVMGLAGLTLSLRAAERALGIGAEASLAVAALTITVFLVIAVCYAAKLVLHRTAGMSRSMLK